ncbi:MAG TPA: GvpL/GvpF family gas vesicle protein [Chloroflexota bacterium]|nr:GvpL/GvpF family gas vesicle protein [Chloroflexota bacterium]
MTPQGELLYLYAVVAADDGTHAISDAPLGIDDRPITILTEGEVAAIVGNVPTSDFDEAPLNANLSQMEWLAPRAEAHQRVNARVAERSAASLPLSFGTIFRTEDSLRRMLRERSAELAERLSAVRGCAEWVVTVRRDLARAAASVEREDPVLTRAKSDLEAASPGRRYLLQRQLDELRRSAVRRADATVASEVSDTATRVSRRIHAEPLVASSEASAPVVARLSALVERAGESQFRDAIDRLNAQWHERGYDVERSGPWPVYRFSGSVRG